MIAVASFFAQAIIVANGSFKFNDLYIIFQIFFVILNNEENVVRLLQILYGIQRAATYKIDDFFFFFFLNLQGKISRNHDRIK